MCLCCNYVTTYLPLYSPIRRNPVGGKTTSQAPDGDCIFSRTKEEINTRALNPDQRRVVYSNIKWLIEKTTIN